MVRRTDRIIWLSQIKVLIWDVDGTLYQEIPEIKEGVHENTINLISKAQIISKQDAEKLFWERYEKLGSRTQTLINCGVNREYVLSGEWYSQVQLKYLRKDERLVAMFGRLKHIRHIINTNGATTSTKKKLQRLGLNLITFEKIITNADMLGRLKPEAAPFRAVLAYTDLPASAHLLIGDRDKTDLEPAKKLGFHTCMVWGKSKVADLSLDSVYDIERLFV